MRELDYHIEKTHNEIPKFKQKWVNPKYKNKNQNQTKKTKRKEKRER